MLDTSNVFLTGEALEALSQWSSTLKAFQQQSVNQKAELSAAIQAKLSD